MSYERVLRAARSMTWAMEPTKLDAVFAMLELRAAGGFAGTEVLDAIRADSIEAAARGKAMSAAGASGATAVLPLFGIISHRASLMSSMSGPGGTSLDRFTSQFRQAVNDPGVKSIVIVSDSPGGSVDGVAELADEIFNARSKKPITAVADSTCASAAYWICSSASEFVCSPSSSCGSIGVFSAYEDVSKALDKQGVKVTFIKAGKYKAEANGVEPLTDDARVAIQSTVDDYYALFVNSVARGRGVGAMDVRNGMGQGRMITARQAVSLKMADRVDTYDGVMARFGINTTGYGGARAFLPQEEADAIAELRGLRTAQEKRLQARASRQEESLARTQGSFGSARDRGHGGGF